MGAKEKCYTAKLPTSQNENFIASIPGKPLNEKRNG